MKLVGSVAEIRRYPVKSMLGETLSNTTIQTTGVHGDRICALISLGPNCRWWRRAQHPGPRASLAMTSKRA